MKKPSISTINKICNLCLAMAFFVRFNGVSFLVFGESQYPELENFE